MALTRREREIAELVALGLTNRAIANKLSLSERTVEGHIDHAFIKLGLSSRTQLALWVGANGKRGAGPRQGGATFPAQLTTFIGRAEDLAALRGLLQRHRVVTVTGPGGSGKTRLALELAKSLASEDRVQVWPVDLSGISDDALVVQVVAAGVAAGGSQIPAEALIEALQSAHGLLLLDNCEHVLSAVADVVVKVIGSCPEIALLVTSREPTHVAGEVTWRVDPLSHSDSVRLFADRAKLAAPGFEVDVSNVESVAEVCRRLDGLPLAIELAAARVAALSPGQIVQRLDDRFALLIGGSRSASERHQTLKATLEWSYRLLPPTERRLFGRLSVFAGTFNLDALEAVAGVEPLERGQLVQLMGLLIDKSLVAVTGPVRGELRYRLLDSMRAFGREMLDTEVDAARIVERHARLYASIAIEAGKRLGGDDASDWVSLIVEEVDNLRAALEWTIENDVRTALQMCSSLAGYWDLHGWIYEGRHWLSRSLAMDSGAPGVERGAALAASGLLAYRQGDYVEASKAFAQTRSVAEAIGDRSMLARALAGLGDVHIVRSEPHDALRCFQQSLDLYRAENDMPSIARGLSRLGNAYDNLVDYEAEENAYRESLTLFRRLNDRIGVADQLFSIGMCRMISGRFESALPFATESIALRTELGDVLGVAWSRMIVGICETLLGRPLPAARPLAQALTEMEKAGDGRGLGLALDASAGPLVMTGRPGVALRIGSAAAQVRSVVGYGQPPFFAPIVDGWMKDARGQLSADEARREEILGQGLSRKAAVRLALEQLGSLTRDDLPPERTALTERERQVTALVAEGLTNRQIARCLSISERTADSHVQHTLGKLGFRSRAQLAAWHARNTSPTATSSLTPAPRQVER